MTEPLDIQVATAQVGDLYLTLSVRGSIFDPDLDRDTRARIFRIADMVRAMGKPKPGRPKGSGKRREAPEESAE